MSVSLKKGERVALSKDSIVDGISVCLGWDTAKYDDDGDFDLDASAFVVTKTGMTRCDEDFIFYNNLEHPSGGVIHSGDNLTGSGDGDDEVIKVILEKLPKYAERIVFCATIFEAERRMQNFGMVDNSWQRSYQCVQWESNRTWTHVEQFLQARDRDKRRKVYVRRSVLVLAWHFR